DDPSRVEVVIYWNTGGQIDLGDYTTVELPRNSYPSAFAVLEADGDPELEIVVSADTGMYLVDVGADRRAGAPVLLGDIVGGQAIVAHDFTGDGVDDLLIADYSGVRLH